MTGSEDEVPLTGGNMNAVVRRGDTVHRTAGPWTPTIHRLLEHLHARGVAGLPRPLGLDERGREVLTFLPGTVPTYPLPSWVWAEPVLVDAAVRLAEVHRASADFDVTGAVWQLPAHDPDEVICLNDVAPYNMVFDVGHRLSGLIDLDTASPGPRVWDLAYLAYRLVPLTGQTDTGAGVPELERQRRRLRLLVEAYGSTGDHVTVTAEDVLRTLPVRLAELADFTAARAAAGADHVAGHVAGYRSDAAWVRDALASLA